MKYVKFLLEKIDGTNTIKYPDDKGLFSDVSMKDAYIYANYKGAMLLEEVAKISSMPSIRNITTGAMQSRFSVMEEVSIVEGTDPIAKVLIARLMNAKYAGLDQPELTEGVAYIVNFLDTGGNLYLGATPSERITKLLEDGTEIEAYLGALQQG
jgi:hypothetical protein